MLCSASKQVRLQVNQVYDDLICMRGLIIILIHCSMVVSAYSFTNPTFSASSEPDIVNLCLDIIKDLKYRANPASPVRYNLKLKPGVYIIQSNENFFMKEYRRLKKHGLLDTQNIFLNITTDYEWPHSNQTLFSGKFKTALKWLDQELKKGLNLTQEIVYIAKSDREFYRALYFARTNRQHTVIKLPHCNTRPCVLKYHWLRRILELQMPNGDGTRLRIQSGSFSLDKDKWIMFDQELKKVIEHI